MNQLVKDKPIFLFYFLIFSKKKGTFAAQLAKAGVNGSFGRGNCYHKIIEPNVTKNQN